MTTERLYYADPYQQHFTSRVIARQQRNDGPWVALDRSAFYPEGGGQPADRGTLNGIAVLDVQTDDAGVVWHRLAHSLAADTVNGNIDWTRRFDHMQQHHGQHLLSAVFEHLYSFKTVSFHLGAEASTIDLETPTLGTEQLVAAEHAVNDLIWRNLPVVARFIDRAELATLPLRKPPSVAGPIRVVLVEQVDYSACGGTHPAATGGVGLLHIRRTERRGNQMRVEFVCGGRAARDLRQTETVLNRITTLFSTSADDVEAIIARLRESEQHTRKQLDHATKQLLAYEARDLLATAESTGDLPVVRRAFNDRAVDDVRTLAHALAAAGSVALLGLHGAKTHVVMAAPGDGPLDCGTILRETLAQWSGRGGGQPTFAQGGIPAGEHLDAVLDALLERVRQMS